MIDNGLVPRRVPWTPLAWIVAGILAVSALGWELATWKLSNVSDGRSDSVDLFGPTLLVLIFILPNALFNIATAWAWLAGPRSFMFGPTGFRFGEREINYQDIVYLRHDYSDHSTDVGLQDGDRIRLRWVIWANDWIATLSDLTLKRLQADALRRLKRGEDLIFGKKLRLNLHAVAVKDRSIPIRDIAFMDSLSGNNMGADYRTLRVGTLGKTTEIDMGSVQNPHVFFGLLHELIDRGEDRIPLGKTDHRG